MTCTMERISTLVESALDKTYREAGATDVAACLREYRRERAGDIDWLVERYSHDPLVGPLVELPEIVSVLERLERDPTGLLVHWPPELPAQWLETLAEIWGTPL
jgi:hypothetical protein